MRDYTGLKTKLLLDLNATIAFFPLETRNKCNEVTQKLEEVINKNIYDYIKVINNIQTLISMYKTLLLYDIDDEDMEERRRIPDSEVNFYVEVKRFCETLINTYKLLNDLDLLEYVGEVFYKEGKIETYKFINQLLEDIDEYILNYATDGRMLEDLYIRLPMINYEIETHSTMNNNHKFALNILNNVYFDLKTIFSRN